MAIEGSLADVNLADICQLLSLGRKTGCLTVTDKSNFGYVYFENGKVVHASVLNQPDRLGDLLVKNGVVDFETLSRALEEKAKGSRKLLGEILVSMGALSDEELEKWITVQIEEAVYDLFTWNQGSFHFNPNERPNESEVFLVSLNTDGLLMEGARRVDEWTIIERKIPSLDLVFDLARDPRGEDGAALSANQAKLVPLIDGTRTVRDLVTESGLVEFEVGKALYELIQGGFAQRTGEKAPDGEGSDGAARQQHLTLGQAFYKAGMLEDAAREFEAALEGNAREEQALYHLGLIDLKNGRAEAALAHLEAIPEDGAQAYAVLRNRALALEHLGRFDDSLGLLERAAKANGGDPDLLLARGISELKGGDAEGAHATFLRYRKLLRKESPPPLFYAFAVLAAAASGSMDQAVELGREGLNLYPAEPAILVNTGAILDHKGDHEAAEQYFMRALNSGSEVPPQAYKNLGDQAFRRGDKMGARGHYEQAIKLAPSLGDDVFMKLGEIALEEDEKEMATLLLQRAVELNPENEAAKARLEELSPLP